MLQIDQLSTLLYTLRAHGVRSYKDQDVELQLFKSTSVTTSPAKPSGTEVDLPVNEMQLPVDLRTDNITDGDKTLFWSAQGDESDSEMPLTNDIPMRADGDEGQ